MIVSVLRAALPVKVAVVLQFCKQNAVVATDSCLTYACVGSTAISCGDVRPVVTIGFQNHPDPAPINLNSPSVQ